VDVILLPSNRPPDRFYRGGRKITEFRREPLAGDREPEDWIASTTTLAGEESLGLSTLADGRSLKGAIEAEPEAWLGAAHVKLFGADSRLLVKLLDAGQRLPVHAHPHGSFAAVHLRRAHGKAEAWYIVDGGEVYAGLKQDVTVDELKSLVMRQDVDTLLGLLHRIEVIPGDVVYVPLASCTRSGKACSSWRYKSPRTCPSCWNGEISRSTANVTGTWGSDLILLWKLSNAAVGTARRWLN
jgi:mannose-6-phosphate isomerase